MAARSASCAVVIVFVEGDTGDLCGLAREMFGGVADPIVHRTSLRHSATQVKSVIIESLMKGFEAP